MPSQGQDHIDAGGHHASLDRDHLDMDAAYMHGGDELDEVYDLDDDQL